MAWAGQGSSGRSHLGFQVPRFAKYWKVLEVLDVLYGSGRKIKGLQVLQVAEVPEGCGRYRGFWEVNDSDVREVLEMFPKVLEMILEVSVWEGARD